MKLTFPHMGNVFMIAKCLLDEFNLSYVVPPLQSKRTLELGTKYCPEGACLPLKITIGSLIEAYELGADTALMVGGSGPCRLGYYSVMQQEILQDAGVKMEVIALEATNGCVSNLISKIKRITKGFKVPKLLKTISQVTSLSIQIDELEQLCFYNRAYEQLQGTTNSIYQEFREQAFATKGVKAYKRLIKHTKNKLKLIPLNIHKTALKIGIVGEIYGNIDPFAKLNLEKKLGDMGVLVHRYVTISDWIVDKIIKKELHLPQNKQYAKAAKPYLNAMIGGHALETIGHTVMYANKNYDGVIQIYPLGCMPEIVAQSILPTVSQQENIPVLTLIVDEMTGEAGYMTRVEAFLDLLEKRRANKQLSIIS